MNNKVLRSQSLLIALLILSAVAYFLLGYYTPREDFVSLCSLYTIAFACFLFIKNKVNDAGLLLGTGIFFRLLLLVALPHFSQDFYRFIWDGRLLQQGINPYNFLPVELMQQPSFVLAQKEVLFREMGNLSATHYSNYPPVNQVLFWLGTTIGGSSVLGPVLVFKIIIILADIGIYIYGRKILLLMGKPLNSIYLYFLNPLIIVELSGNLHFEGVMVFFLLTAIYFYLKNKTSFAGLVYAISVAVKLVPLILLPAYLRSAKQKKIFLYYAITGVATLLLFAAFYSPALLSHYAETISLWFVNFEFNASIYYLVRAGGYYILGYNIIGIAGIALSATSFLIIIFIALKQKTVDPEKLFGAMLLGLTTYFLFSTTVHPWYIITPLALSIFTRYRFVLSWSFFIILSYNAYSVIPVKENSVLLFVEYLPVFGILFWELFKRKKIILIKQQPGMQESPYN